MGGAKAALALAPRCLHKTKHCPVLSTPDESRLHPGRGQPPAAPALGPSAKGLEGARAQGAAGARGPPGAGVPAAGSAQSSGGSGRVTCMQRHQPSSLSLLLGDRPENILKESPAHCHCSQTGYKTEWKQKRLLPSGPPTAARPRR